MYPIPHLNFTFGTANGESHPSFVLENLTIGPLFIEYRQDNCKFCDAMSLLIKDVLGIDFEKYEVFYTMFNIDNLNATFVHINRDHASEELYDSFYVYDKDNRNGVPMFTVVTLGNNSGNVEPYYATAYGYLALDNDLARKVFLRNMIQDAVNHYTQNRAEYKTKL